MDDRELLRLLRRDPQRGFDTLVAQYGGLLYAAVRGRLSAERFGSAEVEDIVADTFSDFYLHMSDYRPERCSIKSYLCVMARNKAIDVLRKAKVTEVPLDEAVDRIDVTDGIEEADLRTQLLHEIKNLGEPDSVIIIRKYYLGQPTKEIAAAVDLTPANVDTRAHRAIEKLRRIFGGKK